MKPMLGRMILFATEQHFGMYDKGGLPYILHPLTVMHRLRTEDEELQCIAVGHDLMEDCEVTYGDLYTEGMSKRVIAGITALTKRPQQTYDEYKAAVKSNPDAIRVKIEDLRHNSDIRRLKGVTQKDIDRVERYQKFFLELVATQEATKLAA